MAPAAAGAAPPRLAPGAAAAACAAMAVLYVGILYLPQLLLRLPPARSLNSHYVRRFLCSAVASGLASWGCFLLLPVAQPQSFDLSSLLALFGLRTDHLATVYPLLLTALLYLGPLVMAALDAASDDADETEFEGKPAAAGLLRGFFTKLADDVCALSSNIFAWRNFVVGPITEEWVFRACMVPLLLCAGYSPLKVMFLCPLFFGLAHLNHYWEMVYPEKQDHGRAALIVGFRFVYTTVFGWYAAFLYLRTGHLVAPLVAHVFCNVMGLPAVGDAFSSSQSKGHLTFRCPYSGLSTAGSGDATVEAFWPSVVGISFIAGLGGFIYLLVPATSPSLYNSDVAPGACDCWLGYCKWRQ